MKRLGCVGTTKIPSRLRYATESAFDLTAEEIRFGMLMKKRLANAGRSQPAVGDIFGALADLGYEHPGDCIAEAERFVEGLAEFKRCTRRPFPTFAEYFGVAIAQGWKPKGAADAE